MFWKNLSQVINKNALGQSDGKIFKFQYHKSYLRYKFPFFMQFDHVIFFGFNQARPNCSKKKSAIQILKKDLFHQYGFLVLNDTTPLRIHKNHMAVKNLVLEL